MRYQNINKNALLIDDDPEYIYRNGILNKLLGK